MFHIFLEPPMTIDNVVPHTKKWSALWDTMKQLTDISYETNDISQLCDRIANVLSDSQGLQLFEQK